MVRAIVRVRVRVRVMVRVWVRVRVRLGGAVVRNAVGRKEGNLDIALIEEFFLLTLFVFQFIYIYKQELPNNFHH